MLVDLQRKLLVAIPEIEPKPGKNRDFSGDLNELFLKELELNDR